MCTQEGEGVSSVARFKGIRMQEETFVFSLLFTFLNSTPASPEATVTLNGLLKFEMCLKPVMLTICLYADRDCIFFNFSRSQLLPCMYMKKNNLTYIPLTKVIDILF